MLAAGAGDHLLDNRPQVHVHDRADAAAGIEGGELQHPFDGFGQAPRLGADDAAVPLHPGRIGDEPVLEVSRGEIDGRHRRAHLVRDAGDELDLLSAEALRPPRVRDNHRDGHPHEQQDAEADGEVARPELRHGGRERARTMLGHEPPPIAGGTAGGSGLSLASSCVGSPPPAATATTSPSRVLSEEVQRDHHVRRTGEHDRIEPRRGVDDVPAFRARDDREEEIVPLEAVEVTPHEFREQDPTQARHVESKEHDARREVFAGRLQDGPVSAAATQRLRQHTERDYPPARRL